MRIINPSQARIYESWDIYKDFFLEDHQGWIVPDLNRIQSFSCHYDFVIANCSTEHWGSERDFPLAKRLHDLLQQNYSGDFVCLCHDPSDQMLGTNILYFPFYAWRPVWQIPDPDMIGNRDRKYLFSNLNRFARDFRVANWLQWQQQPYVDRCYITMHNMVQQHHDYDGHFALTNTEIATWQNITGNLPTDIKDGFAKIFDHRHPAFADTYLHLVSETTIKDKIFLTEKTWQPILAGQLFMIWGNPGIISHLRDLGVDVFDDIVDHGYDAVTDHRSRLEYIHKELSRLALLDWQDIYGHTRQRRQNNSDGFVTGKFISKYVDKVRQRLPKGAF